MAEAAGFPQLQYAGDSGVIVYLGATASPELADHIRAVCEELRQSLGSQLVDLVPSYASILVLYDSYQTDHYRVRQQCLAAVHGARKTAASDARLIELPVYYATDSGADLEALARRAKLSTEEVIALHQGTDYRVYAVGFAPGFAFLGEVDPRIAAPRLATPRQRVPAGSVAIADRQTAVYPAASPGGWNLIGRCPRRLFDASAQPVMPIAVGDTVRFVRISREQYFAQGGEPL